MAVSRSNTSLGTRQHQCKHIGTCSDRMGMVLSPSLSFKTCGASDLTRGVVLFVCKCPEACPLLQLHA